MELQSPREGHRRLEVDFIDFFTEILHWGHHSEKTHNVSALKELVAD